MKHKSVFLDEFEDLFQPHILKRGEGYYDDGRVQDLEHSGDSWTALVYGSNPYEVSLTLTSDYEITSITCDCPYAEEDNCKHMAAVLYELQEELGIKDSDGEVSLDWAGQTIEALEALDREQLLKLLKVLIRQDPDNGMLVRSFIAGSNAPETKETSLDTVRELVETAMDDLIDLYELTEEPVEAQETAEYHKELIDQAMGYVYAAYDRMEPREVLDLSFAVFFPLAKAYYELEEFPDELIDPLYELPEIMEQVCTLDDLTDGVRTEYISCFIKQVEKVRAHGMADREVEFLKLAEHLCRNREHVDLLASCLRSSLKGAASHQVPFLTYELLEVLYRLYSTYMTDEEVTALLEGYIQYPKMRKRLIRRAFDAGRFEDAEALAREGEKLARKKDDERTEIAYIKERCRIYEAAGKPEELKSALSDLYFISKDFDDFLRYKACFPDDQWKQAAPLFLDQLDDLVQVTSGFLMQKYAARVYIAEEEYGRLLSLVAASPHELLDYDEILVKEYPDEVYELYAKLILHDASRAWDRAGYRKVCSLITRLKSIGGVVMAEKVKTYLLVTYSNKPAFKDEVSKV